MRRFPDAPWLSESAVILLDSWLRPTDRGIEWDAGRSTVWFASRVEHLTSVESNPQWYESVKGMLHKRRMQDRVDLRYIPVEDVNDTTSHLPDSHAYSDISDIQDESLDFALVDGMKMRVLCMENSIPKIKPGGLLILDNAEWFFPNNIMGQPTVAITSRDRCLDERWEKLWDVLGQWRGMYTTNGVWDTRFWVKPSFSTEQPPTR